MMTLGSIWTWRLLWWGLWRSGEWTGWYTSGSWPASVQQCDGAVGLRGQGWARDGMQLGGVIVGFVMLFSKRPYVYGQ